MAGADLFWEKSTVGWLLVADKPSEPPVRVKIKPDQGGVSSTRAPARPSCVHGCDLYVNPPGVQGPTRTERNGRGSEHHPSCHDGQRYPLRSSISYTPAGRRQRSSISYILAVFILPFLLSDSERYAQPDRLRHPVGLDS
jgi:hypothetical protein